jgi:hypothetical protein
MKLKMMVDLVVNSCDDCDACQELIHSLDYIADKDRRRDLFVQIEKLICRVNHSIQKFQSLHLYAERCIFGLKNRATFADFASLLNTAVEIVEEVAFRNCTNTQDVDYVKCYGIRAMSKEQQQQQQQQLNPWWHSPSSFDSADGSCAGDYGGGFHDVAAAATSSSSGVDCYNNYFDYYENVEDDTAEVDVDEDNASASASAVSQMLADFESNINNINNNNNSISTFAAAAAAGNSCANDEVVVEVEMMGAAMEEAASAENGEKVEKEEENNSTKHVVVDDKSKSSSKWYSFLW